MTRHQGWAAFNIERVPESFDVALQGLVASRSARSPVSGEVLDKALAKGQIASREAPKPSPLRQQGPACLHVTVLSWLSPDDDQEKEREVNIDFERQLYANRWE